MSPQTSKVIRGTHGGAFEWITNLQYDLTKQYKALRFMRGLIKKREIG